MADTKDLSLILDAKIPIVVVESHDERRVLAMLLRFAMKRQLSFYEWRVTRGLELGGHLLLPLAIDPGRIRRGRRAQRYRLGAGYIGNIQLVVTGTTGDAAGDGHIQINGVVAGLAEQGVGPRAAGEPVVDVVAGDPVGAGIADHVVIGAADTFRAAAIEQLTRTVKRVKRQRALATAWAAELAIAPWNCCSASCATRNSACAL